MFAFKQHRSRLIEFRLKPIGRDILVRPSSSDLSCVEEVFLHRGYDIPFSLRPRVIIDAGANIGMTSLYFGARFPEARILAIEPDQSNFELLRRNCAGLENVTCIRAGLWPTSTPLSLIDPEAEKWALAVKPANDDDASMPKIPSVTIPELMERHDIDRIDILKLDIEGAEQELFASETDRWIDRVDTIAIELHDRLKSGCAETFYAALHGRSFAQEIRGGNTVVRLEARRARDRGLVAVSSGE
jgi:FkbM family methyltransferase